MSFLKLFLSGIMGLLLLVVLLLISVAFLLDRTLLNPDFAMAELDRSNAVGIAKEIVLKNLPADARPYAPAVATSIEELRPWLLQQARATVNAGYDFLFGRSPRLQLTIQAEPLRQKLLQHLSQYVRDNPPPEYRNLSPADQARVSADFEKELTAQVKIDSVYHVDIDSIPADARIALLRAREAVGYFRVSYNLAIALAVVLAVGMVLLRRSFLGVGIVLLLVGVVELGACSLAGTISSSIQPGPATPEEIRVYLPQLFEHLMEPLHLFGVCATAAGLLAIVFAIAVCIVRKAGAGQRVA